MIGYYNYTVWLTYIGMLSSVLGIGFAIGGNITASVICLMFSGFCDMFDGAVASTKERDIDEKRFGTVLYAHICTGKHRRLYYVGFLSGGF